MSNMTVNQRNQFDRVELSVPTTGVQLRNRGPLIAYTVLASVLVAALAYAAVTVFDSVSISRTRFSLEARLGAGRQRTAGRARLCSGSSCSPRSGR